MTTAWVLPGGSSMGALQAGQAEALLAHGLAPDLLIGASAGALNAAWLAADPTPGGVADLQHRWLSTGRRQVFPLSPLGVARGLTGRRDHLVSPRALTAWLEQHLPYRRIEEARLPLTITATDLHSGAPVFQQRGSLIPALLASCAMPGVFPPVTDGDRVLVDGGMVADAPVGRAVALGATRIFVLRTLAPGDAARAVGAVPTGLRALGVMFGATRAKDIARWADRCEIYLLPVPSLPGASPFSFKAGARLVAEARSDTEAWWPAAQPEGGAPLPEGGGAPEPVAGA
jgi:NTE family protein